MASRLQMQRAAAPELTMEEALTPFPLPMAPQANGLRHYQLGPP